MTYEEYGKKVSEEWAKFAAFSNDLTNTPSQVFAREKECDQRVHDWTNALGISHPPKVPDRKR